MNKKTKESFIKNNTLLACGLLFVVVGLILLLAKFAGIRYLLFLSRAAILLFSGAVILYFALTIIKKATSVFIGTILSFVGVLFLFVDSEILSLEIKQIWPLIGVLSGISLIISGFYRYKRLLSVFFIPAMSLICMGAFFLLFSLDIISVPFCVFAATWWPLLFIIIGIGLLCIFAYIQCTNKAVLDDGEDLDDEYEESSE